jgi:hypothetical protein
MIRRFDPEYIERFYKHIEPQSGCRYRLGDLTGPGGAAKGNPQYENGWRISAREIERAVSTAAQAMLGAAQRLRLRSRSLASMPTTSRWLSSRLNCRSNVCAPAPRGPQRCARSTLTGSSLDARA